MSPSITDDIQGRKEASAEVRAPGVLAAIGDLHNAVDLLERAEENVKGRFAAVTREDEPRVAGDTSPTPEPRGTSDVHNRLAEATARVRAITYRLDYFATKSEVG